MNALPAPLTALAPRAASVVAEPPSSVVVTFDDGSARRYDLGPALDLPVFRPLRDPAELARVRVTETRGGIEWPSGADLSAGTLYHAGCPVVGRGGVAS